MQKTKHIIQTVLDVALRDVVRGSGGAGLMVGLGPLSGFGFHCLFQH